MKKTTKDKLHLARETLVPLQADALDRVAGGAAFNIGGIGGTGGGATAHCGKTEFYCVPKTGTTSLASG